MIFSFIFFLYISSIKSDAKFSKCFDISRIPSLIPQNLREVYESIFNQLERTQYNSCSDEFIQIETHSESQGFGVQFVSYYSVLSDAIKKNKTFHLTGNRWNYANFEDCGDLGYECHFKKISSCSITDLISLKSGLHRVMLGRANFYIPSSFEINEETNCDEENKEEIIHIPTKIEHHSISSFMNNLIMHNVLLEPPQWVTEKGITIRQWEGILANILFCPNDEILSMAEQIKNQCHWKANQQMIGIHVRRGDRTDLWKYNLDSYMNEALKIKEKYNVNQIYLASDDPQTYVNSSKWTSQFQFCFISQENLNKLSYKWNLQTSIQVTRQMLVDFYLLSETTHFIGSQRSMFSWGTTRVRLGKGLENENSNEKRCPVWIGNDTKNKYGWWNGGKPQEGECV